MLKILYIDFPFSLHVLFYDIALSILVIPPVSAPLVSVSTPLLFFCISTLALYLHCHSFNVICFLSD